MSSSSMAIALLLGYCNVAIAMNGEDKHIEMIEESPKRINGDTSTMDDREPKYWRAILGDICQLPGFPRATGDPTRYVECVRQSADTGSRRDLGIWLLRECLPGYEFVASARRCKTARSVLRQQHLCDGPNADSYQFCPSSNNAVHFAVKEIRQQPRQCACPNGEANCVCPVPEILEPVEIDVDEKREMRRSPVNELDNSIHGTIGLLKTPEEEELNNAGARRASPTAFSQLQPCPCPQTQPNCVCVQGSSQPQQQSNDINCQTTTTQQQYCPQQQQPVVQPQPCPLVSGGVQNAQYQGICSWMIDPLATDPQSRSHYLQCQPAPNNLFCGRWQRMPCAPATVFDVSAQVCVWDTNGQPGSIPSPTPYVQAPSTSSQCGCTGGVQIGSCNQNYQCPGQSVCQVGQQQAGSSQRPCMVCCYFHKKKY